MMQCTLLVDEVETVMCNVSRGAIKYTPVFTNGRSLATKVLHYGLVQRDRAPSCAQEVSGMNYLR